MRITTLGPTGARIERAGEAPVLVGPVPEIRKADPTGTGDAFRSGFLAAVAWGLSLERAAQLGNMLAVHVLETVGPQEYELKPGALAERLRRRVRPGRGGRGQRLLQLTLPFERQLPATQPGNAGGDGPGAGRPLRTGWSPLVTQAADIRDVVGRASRHRSSRRSPLTAGSASAPSPSMPRVRR